MFLKCSHPEGAMIDIKRRLERKGDSNQDKLFQLLSFCLECEVNVEVNLMCFEIVIDIEVFYI